MPRQPYMSRQRNPNTTFDQLSTTSETEDEEAAFESRRNQRRHLNIEDPEYSPQTPPKRTQGLSPSPSYAQENVFDLLRVPLKLPEDRCGECPCAVTRMHGEADFVEMHHVIAKAEDPEVLHKVERAWELEHNTLNLDTRYNLIPLTPSLHASFDTNAWLLLPSADDLLRLLGLFDPDTMTVSEVYRGQEIFQFKFIPLPLMEGTLISRYNGNYTTKPTREDIRVHAYPFDEIPAIESHIHPHFAIVNAGKKLKNIFGKDLEKKPIPGLDFETWALGLGQLTRLQALYRIYKDWTNAPSRPSV